MQVKATASTATLHKPAGYSPVELTIHKICTRRED